MALNEGKKTWKNHVPIYNTRLYRVWANIKQRCYNPNNTHYAYYGAKGVGMCEEWKNSSKSFIKWALENGYKEGLTIDRIDGDGDYEPSNCRWVTRKEQSANIRSNRLVTINGKTYSVSEWSRITGINKNTLTKRLNLGWRGAELIKPVSNNKGGG